MVMVRLYGEGLALA